MSQALACRFSPQEERVLNQQINRLGRERLYGILESFQGATPVIDVERALYFTRSMKETEGELLTLRWAKALKHMAANITVYITPNQLLAGRCGQLGRYGILHPEIDGDFYGIILRDVSNRAKSPFVIAEKDLALILEEIAPYWMGRTFHHRLNLAMPKDVRGVTYDDDEGLRSKFVVSETASYRSALQWVHDYEKAIKRGLLDLQSEARQRLEALDEASPIDMVDKKPFLEAMITICDAVMIWALRHADLARSLAAVEESAQRRQELLRIAETCARVPALPARNFREAVQCQWFLQMFSRLEQKASAVISNGRMDQYLHPYFARDVAEGSITPGEAKELLECMWVEMAQFIDLYINPTGAEFNEAYAHWEAVTIGGQTPQGVDATNELTYLFLESKREFPLNYPDLAVRVHARSPERLIHEIALTIKDGTGFPKLINDEEIIPLYAAKGASMPEILDYAVSGCTEARLPNRDTYTSGCVYINFAAALEMLLYNGRLQRYGDELIGIETGDARTFKSWDQFYSAYKKQHLNLLTKAFAQQYVVDRLRPQHFATPFASVLHNLCMKHCKDLQSFQIEGGIEFSYFEFLGYGTVVDSLAAIKKLVFEDGRLSMDEVLEALKANFTGHETVQALLRSAPCYGNNDPFADSIARDLDAFSQTYARRCSHERGINVDLRFVPVTSHVPFGRVISATPNGRKAWTALSDGSSASHGADRKGPTAVLLSNYNSKNYQMINRASRLLNIKLSPKCVAGEQGAKKIANLIRAWCDLKLWHLQFNIINRETLLKAQKDPDSHRGLLVRIAGYSAYFCDLSPDLQNDIIERTEHTDF